jgi:hypothetical protein
MEALKIEFQPNLKSKIIDLLSTFSSEEVKISTIEIDTSFDPNFVQNKKMLDNSLKKIRNGTAKLYSFEELDAILEETISKYES